MVILSLDLSSKSTGYAVFDDSQLMESGCIKASSTDVIARIKKITDKVQEIIEKYPTIQKVICEEVVPKDYENLQITRVLYWCQSHICTMLHDTYPTMTVEFLLPSEWRKRCGIKTGQTKRGKLKEEDIKFAAEKYNKTVGDDEADAIGIGHAYLNYYCSYSFSK